MALIRRKLKASSDPQAMRFFMGELSYQNGTPENIRDRVSLFFLEYDIKISRHGDTAQRWANCREEVIKAWIAKAPGTRPPYWWQHDAPGKRRKGETEREFLQRHGLLIAADDT